MKKVFWLVLCSFLVLGACSQSDHDSKHDERNQLKKIKKTLRLVMMIQSKK